MPHPAVAGTGWRDTDNKAGGVDDGKDGGHSDRAVGRGGPGLHVRRAPAALLGGRKWCPLAADPWFSQWRLGLALSVGAADPTLPGDRLRYARLWLLRQAAGPCLQPARAGGYPAGAAQPSRRGAIPCAGP